MQTADTIYSDAARVGARPEPVLLVSEWADAHRYLSSVESPEPGPWRTTRTPYLREIMDCLSSSSPVQEEILMKGAQIGATVGCAGNFIGYAIDQTPAVMLVVMPTVDTAKRWSRQKLEHLIEGTPRLRGKVSAVKSRDSHNTVLSKEFTGGMILITGANSAVGLRSISARYMIFDEIDAYPANTDNEGDPMAIAEKRSQNYPRRKIFKTSTPLEAATSRIAREFARGDQRYYFVPCPLCGHFQVLLFANLKYTPSDDPTECALSCVQCNGMIEEYKKTAMLAAGRWVPTYGQREFLEAGIAAGDIDDFAVVPQRITTSHHISSLYSPIGWLSWLSICRQWTHAQKHPDLLRVVVNTIFGEPWEPRGEAPDWREIYDRREDYEIGVAPNAGWLMTAAADVQDNRIEFELKAWGPGKESWTVAYEILPGDTAHATEYVDPKTKLLVPSPWQQLDQLLQKQWPCEDGRTTSIFALGIDSGFRPQLAYDFALRYPQPVHGPNGSRITQLHTVIVLKGGSSSRTFVESVSAVSAAQKRHGLRIFKVGTSAVKQDVYDRIRKRRSPIDGDPLPPDYAHFPALSADFFQGLCSEHKTVRESGAVEWVHDKSVRNEPLDLEGYNRVVAAICGLDRFTPGDWEKLDRLRGGNPRSPAAAPVAAAEPKRAPVIRSSWIDSVMR